MRCLVNGVIAQKSKGYFSGHRSVLSDLEPFALRTYLYNRENEQMIRLVCALVLTLGAGVVAAKPTGSFPSIDGGFLKISDWAGQPVLVVNTASQCGFVGQYDGMQTLYDRYRDQGLVVLAVPSDDFNQELGSAAEVKEFCELTFGLDFPMADITHVKGAKAHPFYKAVASETGFTPKWNFNKVLISPSGEVAATWGSNVRPLSRKVTKAIEAMLN
jgi:glutathione peroxidase